MNNNLNLLMGNNHAGVMVLKNGVTANYGSIRMDGDKFVYYTGQGLREIFKNTPITEEEQKKAAILKKKTEKELIQSGHIAITLLSDIASVLS